MIRAQLTKTLYVEFDKPDDALLFAVIGDDFLQFNKLYYEIHKKMPSIVEWEKYRRRKSDVAEMIKRVTLSDGRTIYQALMERTR